jgi:DNA polymerase-3 subunit gamma/tau
VIFILATTEVQKIPNTILSRCQRFDFRMISQKEITQHLAHICKTDGIKYEEEALWLIARQAKGSMRDSQSLLDQIITFAEGHITVERVTQSLGLIQREIINRALQAIFERNIPGVAEVVASFNSSGSDPALFVEDLLEQLRNSLMVRIGAHKMNVPVDIPDSELRLLEELTQNVSQEDIHLLFDITLKGSQHLARAIEPRLALEMLLFKLASAPQVQSLARLLDASLPPAGGPPPIPEVKPARKPAHPIGGQSLKPPVQSAPPPPARPAEPLAPPDGNLNAILPKDEIKDPWHRFVENVRASNGLLAALLEHTYVIEQSASTLKLGLPEKMAFLMDKLQDPKNRERLQSFVETYWKQKPAIEVVLTKTTGPQTPVEKLQKAEVDKKTSEREAVENHPMIKKAQSLFKTEIVAIKEEKRQ